MLETVKNWYNDIKVNGIKFFYAYDAAEKKASSTLFYAYIAFYLAVGSVIALHFSEKLLTASIVSLVFWAIAVIFYMLRKISKAKVNLQDKSFDLENSEDSK